jgi:hypothetical protein
MGVAAVIERYEIVRGEGGTRDDSVKRSGPR